jgi:hypothetical protein
MPSRMIDYENLWASEKLAACQSSMRVEYVWLYGCADANGSFELNMRAIHSKVSAIRSRFTFRRVQNLFAEFERCGLLFTWWESGKRYGHWTGSDRPGRLPKVSERHRYKKLAPNVPIDGLNAYISRFTHDPLATASPLGVGAELGLEVIGDGKGVGEEDGEGGGKRDARRARGAGATQVRAAELAAPLVHNSTASTGKPSNQASKAPGKDKSETESGKFQCSYCGNAFKDPRDFQSHDCAAKTAGGWECFKCHETFKGFVELKQHVGRRHETI